MPRFNVHPGTKAGHWVFDDMDFSIPGKSRYMHWFPGSQKAEAEAHKDEMNAEGGVVGGRGRK